ncbi:8686_t:CDS:2 [Paraglomus brasilianum]|uniref:8686_t:CDS:1 n=1 Tax=Paraglomus brasilianum TaxID=144538 RepID=A0A9N9B6L9_9GLOM|nr:8686_t:CDS:2 [Paraglomus brasilianum]
MALLSLPLKRKFSPDDIFFQLGNLELRARWLMKQAIIPEDQAYIVEEEIDSITGFTSPIVCTLQPWCKRNPLYFPTAAAYESHYNASHRYVCLECKAVFPKQRFLELHLNEIHSTFVQLRSERGEKVYECFVEGCKKKFSTVKMRRLHTIDAHKYPKQFYFPIIKYGIVPYSIRRQQTQSRRRNTNKKINSQSASLPSSPTSQSTSRDEPTSMEGLISSMSRMRLVPKSVSFGTGVPLTDAGNAGMEVDAEVDSMEVIETDNGESV